MKHEWKKNEKSIYLPDNKPFQITIPEFNFFQIQGKGNPNDPFFAHYIETLYGLSYSIKMSPKKGRMPSGYYDYSVYPLEGVWDISDDAKQKDFYTLDKNDLVFNLMIRQPTFVNFDFAQETIDDLKQKSKNELLNDVIFGPVTEGNCVQILHVGSYDSEPESFKRMEEFCIQKNLTRVSLKHREIYLSDARRVSQDNLKTVLRIQVECLLK